MRLKEAQALLRARQYAGAYYLAGYAIECALKACIAKQTKEQDFPDRKTVNDSYSHDLEKLVKVAGLREALDESARRDHAFRVNWNVVKDWSPDSRYDSRKRRDAEDIHQSMNDRRHGVMQWIRERW